MSLSLLRSKGGWAGSMKCKYLMSANRIIYVMCSAKCFANISHSVQPDRVATQFPGHVSGVGG